MERENKRKRKRKRRKVQATNLHTQITPGDAQKIIKIEKKAVERKANGKRILLIIYLY